MGIPSFYVWLSKRYPRMVVDVVEEAGLGAEAANPNGREFDHLYLDMNGIIHPCAHPESGPQPANEEEMISNMFDYIDRLVSMVRPRRSVYLAVDGVAPRAKMNQQRSRRFKSAKEAGDQATAEDRIRDEYETKGIRTKPKREGPGFDSNVITPGTEFMARISQALRFYVASRQANDPLWASITGLISDASVPGEGEHKLVAHIRLQRSMDGYDPSSSHVICGLDADLIMLGLASHEPNTFILREDIFAAERKCHRCGRDGHFPKDCPGPDAPPPDERSKSFLVKPHQLLQISVLREYLARDLYVDLAGAPFEWDLERVVDDFVFINFFIGNDFLPHVPSLVIREGAIDLLMELYRTRLRGLNGYLTNHGVLNVDRVLSLLLEIGGLEDTILADRVVKDRRIESQRKQRERQKRSKESDDRALLQQLSDSSATPDPANKKARLLESLQSSKVTEERVTSTESSPLLPPSIHAPPKDTAPVDVREVLKERQKAENPEVKDEVRLGQPGWKDRYYRFYFGKSAADRAFVTDIVRHYVTGLQWVLLYYYQGCPSWHWYFPYHYAPFASEIAAVPLTADDLALELGEPFRPIEQLMAVLPPASRSALPPALAQAMLSDELASYYPETFVVNMNGKKFAWQGVAELPFIDAAALRAAVRRTEASFSASERRRNAFGPTLLYAHAASPLARFVLRGELDGVRGSASRPIPPDIAMESLFGAVSEDPEAVELGKPMPSPIPADQDSLDAVCSVSASFEEPVPVELKFGLLDGVLQPDPVLNDEERAQRPKVRHDSIVNILLRSDMSRQRGGHPHPPHPHPPHPYPGRFMQHSQQLPPQYAPSYNGPPPPYPYQQPPPYGYPPHQGYMPPQPPPHYMAPPNYYDPSYSGMDPHSYQRNHRQDYGRGGYQDRGAAGYPAADRGYYDPRGGGGRGQHYPRDRGGYDRPLPDHLGPDRRHASNRGAQDALAQADAVMKQLEDLSRLNR